MPMADRMCGTCTEMKYERSQVAVGQLRVLSHKHRWSCEMPKAERICQICTEMENEERSISY